MVIVYDTDYFITRAKTKHGDKFDYSKTIYERSDKLVTITCPKHGDFRQTPTSHLSGSGCPICAKILLKQKRKQILKTWGSKY